MRLGCSSTLNARWCTVLYCIVLHCTVLYLNTSSLCSPGRKLWRWSSNWRSTAVWPEPWVKSVGDSSLLHSDFPARRPSNIQESLKFIVFENKKRIYGKLQKNFVLVASLQFKVFPSSLPCYQGTVSSTPPYLEVAGGGLGAEVARPGQVGRHRDPRLPSGPQRGAPRLSAVPVHVCARYAGPSGPSAEGSD